MPRFTILASNVPVGHSDLEGGDPPMGVAVGRFYPLPAYASIRGKAIAARESNQSHLELEIRDDLGSTIPAQSGVQIVDFIDEIGPEAIQVHIVGIPYPLYGELFPAHVQGYRNMFKGEDSR